MSEAVDVTPMDTLSEAETAPSSTTTAVAEPAKKLSPLAQKLASVTAAATKQYALKNYLEASDLYAQAAEIQDNLNGPENPLNADLLYFYGRSLYQCGLAKSDVLGSGLGGGEEKAKSSKDDTEVGSSKSAEAAPPAKKGLFSFQGDENFDEEDEEDAEDEEGEEEEEDDFTLAFTILDLSRQLFEKRLETPPHDATALKTLQERLSDTYDLLGEVSLESESFQQAVIDLQSALELKLKLYDEESTLISEAHYKLSLALEFAAQGAGGDDGEGEEAGPSEEEKEAGRKAAAEHLKLAISSCNKRISKEESAAKAKDAKGLEDAKDLVKELEQRLQDLMAPPPPPEENLLDQDAMNGLLGSMFGAGGDSAAAKKMLEQAISGANPLPVRKKAKLPVVAESSSAEGSSKKRKADEEVPVEVAAVVDATSKKAKVTTEEEEAAGTA